MGQKEKVLMIIRHGGGRGKGGEDGGKKKAFCERGGSGGSLPEEGAASRNRKTMIFDVGGSSTKIKGWKPIKGGEREKKRGRDFVAKRGIRL